MNSNARLTAMIIIGLTTIFLALMAGKACANVLEHVELSSTAQQALLDANI